MGFLIRIIFHLPVNRRSDRHFILCSAPTTFAERILSSVTLAMKRGVRYFFRSIPCFLFLNAELPKINNYYLVLGLSQTPTGARTEFIFKKVYNKWFQYRNASAKQSVYSKYFKCTNESVHLESFQHQNTRKRCIYDYPNVSHSQCLLYPPKRIGGDI